MSKRVVSGSTEGRSEREILERLDVLIAILLRPIGEYTDVASEFQREVLALCDYDKSTAEIRGATGKSATHVNKELSVLRSKGLIKTVSRDGRQVHVRLPAKKKGKKALGKKT